MTVEVGSLEDGFYVADDGEGIPPEELEAVFDEGYTTAADTGETGLRLVFVAVTDSAAGGAWFEFRNVP